MLSLGSTNSQIPDASSSACMWVCLLESPSVTCDMPRLQGSNASKAASASQDLPQCGPQQSKVLVRDVKISSKNLPGPSNVVPIWACYGSVVGMFVSYGALNMIIARWQFAYWFLWKLREYREGYTGIEVTRPNRIGPT